jgi:hypothetical protein
MKTILEIHFDGTDFGWKYNQNLDKTKAHLLGYLINHLSMQLLNHGSLPQYGGVTSNSSSDKSESFNRVQLNKQEDIKCGNI